MILYHGTTQSKAKSIVSDGCINCNAPQNYAGLQYSDDTPGYVYLSGTLEVAFYFGHLAAIKNRDDFVAVFEVEIDEAELEIDLDEMAIENRWRDGGGPEINDAMDGLKVFGTARIARDLILGEDVRRYFELKNCDPKKITLDTIEDLWIAL